MELLHIAPLTLLLKCGESTQTSTKQVLLQKVFCLLSDVFMSVCVQHDRVTNAKPHRCVVQIQIKAEFEDGCGATCEC